MIKFLHDLRLAVIDLLHDPHTIARLDADDNISDGHLKLILVTDGHFFTFVVDDEDITQPDMMIEFCLNYIREKVPDAAGN